MPESNYAFDRDRLLRLDGDRHKIVHNAGAEVSFANIESDLKFMTNTVYFLMKAVHLKYQLKTRFSEMFETTGKELAPE